MKSNVDRYKRNEYAPTHTADIPYEKVTPNKSQELWFVSEKKKKRICSISCRIHNKIQQLYSVNVASAVPPSSHFGDSTLRKILNTWREYKNTKAKEKNYQTTQIYDPWERTKKTEVSELSEWASSKGMTWPQFLKDFQARKCFIGMSTENSLRRMDLDSGKKDSD